MKTEVEELKELDDNYTQGKKDISLQYSIFKMCELRPHVIHSKDYDLLSFHVESFEEAQKIKSLFIPVKNNYLSFSGKEDLQTASPYKVTFNNYDHTNDCKIEWYGSFRGVTYQVWVSFNPKLYGDLLQHTRKQLKHLAFGRYSYKTIYALKIGAIQRYYGDTVVNYLPIGIGEMEADMFSVTIFNF